MSRVAQIQAICADMRKGVEQAIPDEGTRTEMIAALAELERAATDWPMRLADVLDTIEPLAASARRRLHCRARGSRRKRRCAMPGEGERAAIKWRQFELEEQETGNFVYRDEDVLYIGACRDDSEPDDAKCWSACITAGDLEAEGEGATYEAALEAARTDLLMSIHRHWELISGVFQ